MWKRCVVSVAEISFGNQNEIKKAIGEALRQKKGVDFFKIDTDSKSIEVVFDGNQIKCARCICKAVSDTGYKAEVKEAAQVVESYKPVTSELILAGSPGAVGDVRVGESLTFAGGDSCRNMVKDVKIRRPSKTTLDDGDVIAAAQFERVLFISGMTCHSCVTAIESKAKSLPGITSAKVSLMEEKGYFVYNSESTKLNSIIECIKELGFDVSQQPFPQSTNDAKSEKEKKSKVKQNDAKNEQQIVIEDMEGSSGFVSVTIAIKGMSCSSCVAKIEGDIQKLDGVKSVSVSLIGEKGAIVFDPVMISVDGIVTVVKALGYDCQILETRSGQKSMSSIEFYVNGHVNEASWKELQDQLLNMEGVEKCLIDTALSAINVTYQNDKTSARRILERINSLGYSAHLKKQKDSFDHSGTIYKWRRSFFLSLLFAIPTMAIMFSMNFVMIDFMIMPGLSLMNLLMFLFAVPVQFYAGMPIYQTAWSALRHRTTNMDVLIALATWVSFIYSCVIVFFAMALSLPASPMTFFESSAMLMTFVSLGRWLESIARGKTSDALSKLISLQPLEAVVVKRAEDGTVSNEVAMEVELVEKNDILKVVPGEVALLISL